MAFRFTIIFISLLVVSAFTLSDAPVFMGVMNFYADLVPTSQPVNCTLNTFAFVYDEDGVDTVIASYKNRSTTIWRNATMTWMRHIDEGEEAGFELYSANLTTFTMDRNHSAVIWNIKFFANDTLGNWAESNTVNYSINYLYDWNTYTQYQFPVVETILLLTLGISGLLAMIVIIRKLINR